MSRPIPVSPERWAEMVQAWAENTQLKAEVKRLEQESAKWRRAEQAVGDKCIEFAKTIQTLKAEVERLNKPAVIGGYNISEYIRMANSETLEFDNGDIFADMTLPERIKYIVESHAKLKAEVERLKGIILAQSSDFVRNGVRQEEEPKPEGWNTSVARAVDLLAAKDKEIEQLRHALDLMVEGYEQGSVDGFNLGLMAAKECKLP